MNRRVFVKSGALSLVTLGLSPSFLRRTAFAMDLPRAARGKTLIVLFQRGAADALNVVVRSATSILRRASAARDQHAGAHEWSGGRDRPRRILRIASVVVVVQAAVGSRPAGADSRRREPKLTRSHFDAQDYMETGTPDAKARPTAG
jgi:uncharacterized protein (DUF1501 family)